MRFTGRNLVLVWQGLRSTRVETWNQIVTCPDAEEYAPELAQLEAELAELDRLIKRVERAIEKENQHG